MLPAHMQTATSGCTGTVDLMTEMRAALARLRGAASDGSLSLVCERYRVELLVAFGSATLQGRRPNDLDLAVLFGAERPDTLGLLDDLSSIAGTSRLDLMDLRVAGPVARERALLRAVRLFEANRGTLTRMQMAAMTERMDTEWLRRLDLELMAR
jgi:Polymerase beta, Nucleotidyltransferase